MAKFLKGNDLNTEIGKIFENAESKLMLISPYIKLHHRYADELKAKVINDKLEIIIVFGKNERDITKSLTNEDLAFFKQFPNIEIRYEKRLHAKFYANETTQILTSMNLYDYSQDENIEAGVKTNFNPLSNIAAKLIVGEKTVDEDAWGYFKKVVEHSELLFKNEPEYESSWGGLTKRFKGIKNKIDKISEHFLNKPNQKTAYQKNNYPEMGFCIRTGEQIPFNPQRPFSNRAFESWSKFKNENYPEKYCHKTGKLSNGNTSMANPIL